MALSIQDLRSNLNLGGARPTLFEVHLSMPAGVDNGSAGRKLQFMCKATELPQSEIGVIRVPYFGRIVKYAGDRNFAAWPIRIINDEDFAIRNAFETWHSLINTRLGNRRAFGSDAPDLYKTSGEIRHFDRTGKLLKTYVIQGAWPSNVSSIQLDWGAQDSIEEFDVTLEYDWYDIKGVTGTGGPSI